ncbi:hypothetical protein TVAG_078090 [Trichomonas vaginalis G3]|uniref:Glycosyltransferase 61 catalytic domain-containing protein n=1 Tax=Trichomonas vaginalis (strain ATCC PRA-98 / G3) TaxID=412133 RepID=A2FIB2_TRIV3|nr:glycosyltransferase family [Trichomonas vaginalis G3]EAX95353.1 hypothetical protein TVAG_078090 [Trichomonas vaginalis G3]KAI5521010.1 glycosyltransferase family [Trichomonas vaginalis G3]|eukprot:XP_001308283.1 hypothetical protein [Trichomonas vaginalis G3]
MRFIISTENDYFDIDKYIGKTLNITSWKKWKDIPNLEVKELYFNIPINKLMAMVQNCPKSYLITYFSSSAVREFTRLIHIKNVFVTKEGIYKDSSEIKLPNSKIKFRSKKILFNGTIYDKLIYGVNTWGAWGHFLNGSPLSGLLYFPEEIVRQSMFYWQVQDMRFAHDVYEFGFQIAGIAVIDSTAVFVRDLYISAPIDIVNGQNHFTRMLREKVYKFYKLENVIPKYGLITNRRPGSNRCVRNMDEFIKEIKAKYPHIEWLYRNDSQLIDTPRAVKDLANTKYFICPAGSNSFKCVFLHENCGM